VVDGVVAYVSLNSRGGSEIRKLGGESVDRSTATDYVDAGDPRAGSLGRCRQRRDTIQQAVVSTVH
jgi:hypothetical protein